MWQIWTDGIQCDEKEEGSSRFATTEAIDRSTSCTFAEIVVLIHAIQWITEHTGGCSVDVYSDSLSALQYVFNNYYEATAIHVKGILVESSAAAARRSSINVIQIPGHQVSNGTTRPTERLPKPCDMLNGPGL